MRAGVSTMTGPSQLFGNETQDGGVHVETVELDQRDAELLAEHLIEMFPGDELQVEEDFAQMPRVRALKLQRAVQLVLADEPQLEETSPELERRDSALALQGMA